MNLDIGVIQKRSEPAYPIPPGVAAMEEFAVAIAGRYLPSELTVSHAELALAFPLAGETNYFEASHYTIAPEINIHDHHWFAPVSRDMAIQTLVTRERAQSPAPAAELFERVLSRQIRVESFTERVPRPFDGLAKRMLPGVPSAIASPVERILRAAPVAQPAEPTANPSAPEAPAGDSGWGTPFTPTPVAKPFTLPSAEVKRVTEQVIREIDHRIIARRERMGKR